MINKFDVTRPRNAEYFQFMVSARDILAKYGVVRDNFGCLYDELRLHVNLAETAMIAERKNEKVAEKNEADRYRDRMHSKLFNYLKFILYDERDPRYDDAQDIMRVVKDAGNPTRLAENAQSAMMTALGNRLEPLRSRLEAIGAQPIVDDMMEANRKFIAIEAEYREMLAAQKLSDAPASMAAVRKLINPVYRSIVAAINGYANVPSKKETVRELIAEMNVLIARYDALLATRKRDKKENEPAENKCECKT